MGLKYAPYSASRISLWNSCPRKFKYNYIDKIPKEPRDDTPLKKGFCTHLFLENHTANLGKERLLKEISREKIPNEIVQESKKIYKKFVDSDLGKKIFSYLPLGTELEIGLKIQGGKIQTCDFLDPGCLFRGKIDYICVDKENDKVYVIDWKTGKDKSEGPYKQKPDQLIYYAAWYFHNFPVDELELEYIFVEHGTSSSIKLVRDKLDLYLKVLLNNIKSIENDNSFDKIEGPLCNWCEYRDHCIRDQN